VPPPAADGTCLAPAADEFRSSPVLQNGKDVARRILEPCDGLGSINALLVRFRRLVSLEADPALDQGVDGLVDVVDHKVEDREGRRNMVGL
jgi:hypothetical protein